MNYSISYKEPYRDGLEGFGLAIAQCHSESEWLALLKDPQGAIAELTELIEPCDRIQFRYCCGRVSLRLFSFDSVVVKSSEKIEKNSHKQRRWQQ